MKLMNVNIKSKQTILATFVVLVGLVSIVFSHTVQAQTFFGPGCISIGVDCNHNGNHQGDHGKGLPGTKGDTRAQDPIGSQDQAGAGGSANGGDVNGGDAQGNNGDANSGWSGSLTDGNGNGNTANGGNGGN
jgi:hypothetical protein